jgi:hypothetical protein
MREFETPLRNIRAGLRAEGKSRNTDFLSDCMCVKPGKFRLEGYTPDITPFPSVTVSGVALDLTIDWPFPMIYQTDSGLYIGAKSGVYMILTMGASTWTAAKLGTWSGTITWPWTLANCPMFPVFGSGDLLVYYDYAVTAWKSWDKAVGSDNGSKWDVTWSQPVAVCFNNGQVMTGGAKLATTAPSDSRLVRWSQIGSFDFLGESADARFNTAGFYYLPTDDDDVVLAILPLEKNFIVYSTYGIFAFTPVDTPATTFGVKQIYNTGISCVGAAAWNGKELDSENICVDRNGDLVHIGLKSEAFTRTLEVKNLGFSEFLLPMLDDKKLHITFNPHVKDGEWYISDGVSSYLYNGLGLGATNKCITSIISYHNAKTTNASDIVRVTDSPIGFYRDTGRTEMLLVTDTLDFGIRGIKTIQSVEVGYDADRDVSCAVAVDFRYDKSSPYRRSAWKRVNKEGIVVPMVSGVDLRIVVRAIPCDVDVDYVNIRWKLPDKRNIRGVYSSVSASNQ